MYAMVGVKKDCKYIGIVDCDLIARKQHRFPNLACMKISAYYKSKGCFVFLIESYDDQWFDICDHVFISKVFTDTEVPEELLLKDNVTYGGSGFYFDKAEPLPNVIEHSKPDYHLYDRYIASKGCNSKFEAYVDYSIGFLTRGCFRGCKFCINQNKKQVLVHSPLEEFVDESRKIICLLDDNFLGCKNWKKLLQQLQNTGKRFMFKQGLDERLLTEEKVEMLFNSKYYGDYIFAFDNIKDYDLIESKLKLIRKYTNKENIKFYVLVGFESTDAEDIFNMFKRIELIMKYRCIPFIMKYQSKEDKPFERSKYKSLYVNVSRWCNQHTFIRKLTYREFCIGTQKQNKTKICSALKGLMEFEKEYPEEAKHYFDMRYGNIE